MPLLAVSMLDGGVSRGLIETLRRRVGQVIVIPPSTAKVWPVM